MGKNEGSLHEAVRASTSIPTLFTPVQRDGMILTDGGVLNNLPVNHVKKKWRTKIFAVNANAHFVTHEIAVGKEEVGKSAEEMMENPIVEIKTNSENINQNKNIKLDINKLDSVQNEEIEKAKIVNNDSALRMFYQLIRKK